MFNLCVRNHNGDKLKLNNFPVYDVLKIEGLNPPPAINTMSDVAGTDGAVYNSSKVDKRNIVITLKIYNPVEQNRVKLYKYFPYKKNIRLYFSNDSRKVYIDGYVDTFEFDLFTQNETVQISILCDDPYFKEETDTVLTFSSTVNAFEFPFSIPAEGVEFSTINCVTNAIFSNSDVDTGMLIEFRANTDQVLNPRLINRTTQEFLQINFDMNAGDVIRVNTHSRQKSVTLLRDGVETNILNSFAFSEGSKWVTLASGDNELSYECDVGQANLTVTVSTYKRYIGV